MYQCVQAGIEMKIAGHEIQIERFSAKGQLKPIVKGSGRVRFNDIDI